MIERSRTWQPGRPVDVAAVLGVHRRGFYDPAFQVALGSSNEYDGTIWRGCRVGERPVTVRIRTRPPLGAVEISAWADDDDADDIDEVRVNALSTGDALDAVLDAVPRWLGALDDPSGFEPQHPVLARAFRENPGVLVGRSDAVVEALVPAVLEQKVTGIEAYRGWSAVVRMFGALAPGVAANGAAANGPVPPGLRVPPADAQWARIPSWEWHRAGVGPQRSRTIVTATRAADRLVEAATLSSEEADRRLQAIPGVGVWTSAEVRQRSHGDADAVSVGDYGLPHVVSYALTGERRGSDERMLELLEPYRGHRHRACRLLLASGVMPPRRGPRAPVRDYRTI